MLPGGNVDGPESVVGPVNGNRLAIEGGSPAGVVGIGQDEIARLVALNGQGHAVEIIAQYGQAAGGRGVEGPAAFKDDRAGRVEIGGANGLPGGGLVGRDDGLADERGPGLSLLIEVDVDLRIAIENRDNVAVGGRPGFAGDDIFDAQEVVTACVSRRCPAPVEGGIGQG